MSHRKRPQSPSCSRYVKRKGPVKAVRCGLAQALETARQKVGPAAAAALSAALLTLGQPEVRSCN